MHYDKKTALSVIFDAAKAYEENLRDNNLLFVCWDKHKRISYLEVEFNASNFMHLTGMRFSEELRSSLIRESNGKIDANSDITFANEFYDRCINKRLSVEDFEFAEDGTTPLKLDVLPTLMKSNLSVNAIGDFDARTVKLYTEKIAGNINGCMGFIRDEKTNKNVPNTVLKADVRDCVSESKRILITYRKKKDDLLYNEIVYVAKKVEWDDIEFSKEYEYLSKPNK